jgi:AcrR family transcriptional regulator
MRADALQNRQRLLEAADAMFREHGIEVSVAEIADAAGVGRGTVFRNFRSKDHLIVAVASQRAMEAVQAGHELLESNGDDAELVFTYIADIAERQQANRALLEAVSEDEFSAHPDMAAVHTALIDVLDALLARGQEAGSVRPEVTAMDVMSLLKGLCMNPMGLDSANPEVTLRHLDLVRAAITTPAFSRPLRGVPPTALLHPRPAPALPAEPNVAA